MSKISQNSDRDRVIAFVEPGEKLRGRHLKDLSLDELEWPFGRPDGLDGKTIGDLDARDHILTPPHLWVFGGRVDISPVNLTLMVLEPRAYHQRYIWLAKLFYRRFYRVLGCDESLLLKVPNSEYLIAPHTFVADYKEIDCTKTKMLSLIASNKKSLVGHKLRHRVAQKLMSRGDEVDIMGSGYRAFGHKSEGLAAYRYSLVIENSRQFGYFTEKLIDALLMKTVPIYWGAPDVSAFFDTRGMIVCNTGADLYRALDKMSVKDYEARIPFMEANLITALQYQDYRTYAVKAIEDGLNW